MKTKVASAARGVAEMRSAPGSEQGVPLWQHPEWSERFPWLAQGITGERVEESHEPFDLALFGEGRTRGVMERWRALGRAVGIERIVHGQQVHGAVIRLHQESAPGLFVSPDTDGHVTRIPGILLTVSIADCVPISLVASERRVVALLHGGWRGIAAGILERGIETLTERMGARADELHAHFGPAICGDCYEVGPEVHRGLGLSDPGRNEPVDLRAVLAERAAAAGLRRENVTSSTRCTKCGDSPFFSHRGGRVERQVALLGILPG
jgi:YfiH family protein